MNLSEEKKHPLRSMPIQQKKTMLENFFESRGSSGVDFYLLLSCWIWIISVHLLTSDV